MDHVNIRFHFFYLLLYVLLPSWLEDTTSAAETESTAIQAATALVKYVFPVSRILIPYIFIGSLVLTGE